MHTRAGSTHHMPLISLRHAKAAQYLWLSSSAQRDAVHCCSTAGLRSGRYAEELLKEGFEDVRNLEGSILAWVTPLPELKDGAVSITGAGHSHGAPLAGSACRESTSVLVEAHHAAVGAGSPKLRVPYMQTQAGYPLVKEDMSPTTDVHVFSKDWALQGDGYHGIHFSKGG